MNKNCPRIKFKLLASENRVGEDWQEKSISYFMQKKKNFF